MIGIAALGHLTLAAIPLGLVARQVGELVYEGLTYLASDASFWAINGSVEDVESAQRWVWTGNQSQKRRIQELLGIQERRSSRFLAVGTDHVPTTFNDMGQAFAELGKPLSALLDAWWLADQIRDACPGILFTLNVRPSK